MRSRRSVALSIALATGAFLIAALMRPVAHADSYVCRPALSGVDYRVATGKRVEANAEALTALGLSADAARDALALLTQALAGRPWPARADLEVALRVDPCGQIAPEVAALTLSFADDDITIARRKGRPDFALVATDDRLSAPKQAKGALNATRLEAGLLARGVPHTVTHQILDSFAADSKLPGKLLQNASFTIDYSVTATRDGTPISADLTAAILSIDGQERRVHYYHATQPQAQSQAQDATLTLQGPANQGPAKPSAGLAIPSIFRNPVPGGVFTSGFGWRMHPVLRKQRFHQGVDFSAPLGTPVYAAADGVAAEVGRSGNYGRLIRLTHPGALETVYAHLNDTIPGLRQGMGVRQGQLIGYVGRTGLASGTHLYFEVWVNGKAVDPLTLTPELRAAAVQAARTDTPLRRYVLADYSGPTQGRRR